MFKSLPPPSERFSRAGLPGGDKHSNFLLILFIILLLHPPSGDRGKIKPRITSGSEYDCTITVIALQTPSSCMPPPCIVCHLFHCSANMFIQIQNAKKTFRSRATKKSQTCYRNFNGYCKPLLYLYRLTKKITTHA